MKTAPLFSWQVEALAFLKTHKRALLRMDTGLGKTRTYIEHARQIKASRVLIIAPAYLRYHYARQIKQWCLYTPYIVDSVEAARNIPLTPWTMAVVSYDWFTSEEKTTLLKSMPWCLIICDEAHRIKNWAAKRTQNIILKLCHKRKNIVLGTATPFTRSAADLHPVFSLMQPGKWGTYKKFCDKYCERKFNPWTRKYEAWGVNDFFADKLKEAGKKFTFKRKKRDVQKYLPKLTTQYIPIEIDSTRHSTAEEDSHAAVRRNIGLAKTPIIAEAVRDFDPKESAVIFCHHREVGEIYKELFLKARFIHGGVSMQLRDHYLQKFQAGKVNPLILTYGAGSEGIEATTASIVVHAELPWSYRELKQARDRVMRTGQTKPVHEYIFIAEGTLDESILEVLVRKVDHEEQTIGHIE